MQSDPLPGNELRASSRPLSIQSHPMWTAQSPPAPSLFLGLVRTQYSRKYRRATVAAAVDQ